MIIDDASDVDRWRRIVTREWWTVAWPPGTTNLTDLFEGIDH